MTSTDADELHDPERIYIAITVKEARAVEEWLTAAGIGYAVEVEPYARTTLFGSTRMGAAVYVEAGQAAYCREQLATAGFRRIVE